MEVWQDCIDLGSSIWNSRGIVLSTRLCYALFLTKHEKKVDTKREDRPLGSEHGGSCRHRILDCSSGVSTCHRTAPNDDGVAGLEAGTSGGCVCRHHRRAAGTESCDVNPRLPIRKKSRKDTLTLVWDCFCTLSRSRR